MAQNFWTAIFAWTACFVATIVISLLTRQTKTDEDLKGLVYSLTPGRRTSTCPGGRRPRASASLVLVLAVVLNVVFW